LKLHKVATVKVLAGEVYFTDIVKFQMNSNKTQPQLWASCVVRFVCFWRDSHQWAMASSFTRFLYHTQWRTTVGRTPLDEWSARRRDLYLTHNNHNRQTSMPPVEFEPTISAGERLRLRGHRDQLCRE